jgi:hypothetical protein
VRPRRLIANEDRRDCRKKRAGDWIGGSTFDVVSGNATTVAEICRFRHSRRYRWQPNLFKFAPEPAAAETVTQFKDYEIIKQYNPTDRG